MFRSKILLEIENKSKQNVSDVVWVYLWRIMKICNVVHGLSQLWAVYILTYNVCEQWSERNRLFKLEVQVGQKSLAWIRLITICYIVAWWLSEQIVFSSSEPEVVWKVSRWPSWWPLRISERNAFSISKSPRRPNSYQVSAQFDSKFSADVV